MDSGEVQKSGIKRKGIKMWHREKYLQTTKSVQNAKLKQLTLNKEWGIIYADEYSFTMKH